MTLCPGRKGPSIAGGAWDRDLATDLAAVRAWHPDIAIALLEDHEFEILDLPNFRRDVHAAELPWVFVPIVDGCAPDERFTTAWSALGPRVRNILRTGGRVLIHCRAGLGRTGLVAALLLVDFGLDADAAVTAVRAARPGTIETNEQLAYVRAHRPPPPPPSRESAIAGCLFGSAIGDALGSAFEFVDAGTIARHVGEPFVFRYEPALPGSLMYPRAPGIPTDDTAMSLSVAFALAANPEPTANDFGAAFATDLDRMTGRFGRLFWEGGPGGATQRALARLRGGADPATCGDAADGGNGTAMRAHPVGVLRDRDAVARVAAIQARVTHGHPSAIAAAQAVALTVHDALAGSEATPQRPPGVNDELLDAAWSDAFRDLPESAGELPPWLTSIDMSAWKTVAGAHAIAYLFRADPMRAIAAAAASGGDTDTVAAIVGAIVGARSGIEALDPDLVRGLASSDVVREAADALRARVGER